PSRAPYLGSPDRSHFLTVAVAWETSLLSCSNSAFANVNSERPHSKHTESLGNTKRAGVLRFSFPEKWMQISESSSDSSVDPHFSHIFKSPSRIHARLRDGPKARVLRTRASCAHKLICTLCGSAPPFLLFRRRKRVLRSRQGSNLFQSTRGNIQC